MTRTQFLSQIRKTLLSRREALSKALSDELQALRASQKEVGDSVDAVLDADCAAVNAQLAEAESRELADIENALERIEQGAFGKCEGCGGRIPVARLKALPYATTCVKCQQASEQQRAAGGYVADWSAIAEAGNRNHRQLNGMDLVG